MAEVRPTTPTSVNPNDEVSDKEVSCKLCRSCQFSNDTANHIQETFEDAAEITPRQRTSSLESGRSLTDRKQSTGSGKGVKGLAQMFDTNLAPPLPNRDTLDHKNGIANREDKESASHGSERLSVGPMDEVSLEDGMKHPKKLVHENFVFTGPLGVIPTASHSRNLTQSSINTLSSKTDVEHSKLMVQGLSGPVSMNDYPPPPSVLERKRSSPDPAAGRSKFSSPFSWLSRATSGNEKKTTPIPSSNATGERRGTQSSVNSNLSNPEMMLGKISEGQETGNTRSSQTSLKDRFKMLRMQEEAGINMEDESPQNSVGQGGAIAGLIGRSTNIGFGIGSPTLSGEEKDGPNEHTPIQRAPSGSGPQPPQRAPTIDANLAPGTAVGIAAGPSATPVDWDLWQSVVYEGPAAVARVNPEDLNQAIVSGIPQAIRGVVWQVLAKSKDERLEAIYHELAAKGTEKEKTHTNGHTSMTGSDGTKEKDSIASSASSIHSNPSTPASTVMPTINGEFDIAHFKTDPVKVQRLERMIKRDLGSRTSYSKYMMAAGLQDGLFGVCKAYALYDEHVGYAQGMNFIAMPLLFNVSSLRQHTTTINLLTTCRCLRRKPFL